MLVNISINCQIQWNLAASYRNKRKKRNDEEVNQKWSQKSDKNRTFTQRMIY